MFRLLRVFGVDLRPQVVVEDLNLHVPLHALVGCQKNKMARERVHGKYVSKPETNARMYHG